MLNPDTVAGEEFDDAMTELAFGSEEGVAMAVMVKQNGRAMGRRARDPDLSTYCGRFAARLKQLRLKAGMDQEQAAAAITRAGYPITGFSIYSWEVGRAFPHYRALSAVAKAYGVKVRQVIPDE